MNSASLSARMAEGWRLLTGPTARGGLLAGADQGVISLTNFAAALLLARSLSPTQFGSYAVSFLGLHLVRALLDGAIIHPMTSLGPGMEARPFRTYLGGAAILQAAAAAALALAAATGGVLLTVAGNNVAGPTVFALWFPTLAWSSNEFLRRAFYARGRVHAALVNTGVASVVRLVTLGGLLALGARSGSIGMEAIGWGGLAGVLLGVFQARRLLSFRSVKPRQVWGRHSGMARWLVLGSVGNWASNEVYPLLTAGLVSFAAAGAYRALQTVVAPVHVYLRTIDTYFAPRVAAAFDAGGRAALLRSLRRIFALVLVPVAGVVAVASLWPAELLQLFFRETYVGFAAGLPFLAVFYLTWSLYAPLQMAFRAIRVTRPIFRAHAAAAAAMFTLGVLAIRRWGLYGALGGQTLNAAISGVILLGAWWAWRKGSLREKTEAAPAAGVEV